MTISAPNPSADLLPRLAAALAEHSPRRKYLVGVSGGCDSMVLLTALHQLGYRHLIVCHLDHGLRGRASRADASLTTKRSAKLGYASEHELADTRKAAAAERKSLELAARDLRHAFFLSCAKQHRCHRIFLAHHADDQVETILFNFLRGSGAAGLAGMRPASTKNGLTILRPFLGITRAEIESFAQAHRVPFREDASNESVLHTRNRIRHDLLPTIEAAMGSPVRPAILRAAEILREEDQWMESQIPTPTAKLSSRVLAAMPLGQRRRTVLRWLQASPIPEPGFFETERVLSLLNDGSGPAKVSLPGDFAARRRAGEIFLEKA